MSSAPVIPASVPRPASPWTPPDCSAPTETRVVGVGTSNQGIAGFASNNASPAGTSGVSTANGGEYSGMGSSYGSMSFVDNSFTYGDDFTWLKDKHTFKFGVQFIRYQSNCFSPGNDGVLGSISYTGVWALPAPFRAGLPATRWQTSC